MSLSIIIPTFNESRNIRRCLERTVQALPDAEILVVDGGTDETENIVKEFALRYPNIKYVNNKPDLGKGHAIRTGINNATQDIIAQLDADLQFSPEELKSMTYPILSGEADFVMGSRFLPNSLRKAGSTPLARTLGNKSISLLASILFAHRMTDVLAGFKVWKKEVTKSFTLSSDNYSYEVELPIMALKNGFRVIDFPVSTDPRIEGESTVRVFKVGFQIIRDILRFRLR